MRRRSAAPSRWVDRRHRTCVRYAGPMGSGTTWTLAGRSRRRCSGAELLGVDLATVCKLAAKVEPYLRADGTRIWSLMQLERQLRPRRTAGAAAATSTADGSRLPMASAATSNVGPVGGVRHRGVTGQGQWQEVDEQARPRSGNREQASVITSDHDGPGHERLSSGPCATMAAHGHAYPRLWVAR